MTTSSVNGAVLGCGGTDQGHGLGEFEHDVTVTADAAVGYAPVRSAYFVT